MYNKEYKIFNNINSTILRKMEKRKLDGNMSRYQQWSFLNGGILEESFSAMAEWSKHGQRVALESESLVLNWYLRGLRQTTTSLGVSFLAVGLF